MSSVTGPNSLAGTGALLSGEGLRVLSSLLDTARALIDDDHAAQDYLSRALALIPVRELPAKEVKPAEQTFTVWQADRLTQHIDGHLDRPIRVDTLIAMTRLSSSYFFMAFKATFGVSPHAYIMMRRIERAKVLVETTDERLSQIALVCGLNDQAHLSRLFKKQVGMSPGSWRRLHRGLIAA